MNENVRSANIDAETVRGFGDEWRTYDQTGLPADEHRGLFDAYFSTFPFNQLPDRATGFDLGCGSGRWARLMAERVGTLHCIDPAEEALAVARRTLADKRNAVFHLAAADTIPLPDESQDFGYSLGVLHHIPDTEAALRDCVRKLKPGAPFLLYLYYSLDNRPPWFQALWRASDLGRRAISRLPFRTRKAVTTLIAVTVYLPLARSARLLAKTGANVSSFPLSAYRDHSFYTLRTDALDRFGTKLEQRFSRAEIERMMNRCGLERVRFREGEPFWVACGVKAAA